MTPVWLWENCCYTEFPPSWRYDGAGGPAAPGTTPLNMWFFGGTIFSPLSKLKEAVSFPARFAWVWGRTWERACPPASAAAAALRGAGTAAAFTRVGPSPLGGKKAPCIYQRLGAGSRAASGVCSATSAALQRDRDGLERSDLLYGLWFCSLI